VFSREAEQFSDALNMVREGHPLPLVFIGSGLISSGGKIAVSKIVRRLDALGIHPAGATESQ